MSDRRVRGLRPFLVLAVVLFAVACTTHLRDLRRDVPRQGWWDERGPVVPHDSFPDDCALCHEGGDWTTIRADFEFDHLAETGVALLGSHSRAECLRCHNDRGPVGVFAARGCAGCHEDEHRGQLGRDCSICHDEDTWRPTGEVASHFRTRFPLVGAHVAVACWRCHEGAESGVFTGVGTECVACHTDDLARAVDPDHLANGWTSSCDRCHVPVGWSGSGFTHPIFPLTGAHAVADCGDCHLGGVFTGATSDCYACHMDDYTGTTDPDHVALGFPTDCAQCHGTATWQGAAFDHTGIVSGCATCHQDDYDATTDPDHMAAGFPSACEICHTTTSWFGADFDHTFPIDAGQHSALDCSDCHPVAGNYMQFTCLSCKEHAQPEMDDKHEDEPGYVYDSAACLSCHPDGDE